MLLSPLHFPSTLYQREIRDTLNRAKLGYGPFAALNLLQLKLLGVSAAKSSWNHLKPRPRPAVRTGSELSAVFFIQPARSENQLVADN